MEKRKISLIVLIVLFILSVPIIMGQVDGLSDSFVTEIDDVGTNINSLPYKNGIVYKAHGIYWVVAFAETDYDMWIYNSTDKINWSGSEFSDKSVWVQYSGYYHKAYAVVQDYEDNLHIIWVYHVDNTFQYCKLELNADGTYNDLGDVSVGTSSNWYLIDFKVDGLGYPVYLKWGMIAGYHRIVGSSTRDGTWTQDYENAVTGSNAPVGALSPMTGNSGKDWLVVYSTSYPYQGHCKYFDEATETFGAEQDLDNSYYAYYEWNTIDIDFENNITFVTSYGEHTGDNKWGLYTFKTIDGGVTWSRKLIYEVTSHSATDYVGHIPRLTNNDSLVVYFRHNDMYAGNHTFLYSQLNYENIGTGFTGAWDVDEYEIYQRGGVYDNFREGKDCWTIASSGVAYPCVDGLVFLVDPYESYDNPPLHILNVTYPAEEEEPYPLPELLNITINGFVDGDYLFEGEVYEIDSYWNNTDYCYFQLNDTEHVWEYFYYNESQYMGINVADFEGLITNELVVGCSYVYIDNNFTGVNENLTRLKWKFILNTQVVDCFNRTLSYYGENQWGNVTSGDTVYDEINIYNLGGYVTYDIVGDAGRITKGDAWELWAENGTVGNPSYAYAETVFRKLQHVHFLVEIDLDLEWNSGNDEFDFDGGGYVEYGIDYRLNQAWVTGWRVKIYPQLATSIDVGNHGAGNDQNWIYWSIEWYYNDTLTDQDFIYSNCYGYDHVGSNHGYTNRTSAQLWVDLWFNKMNASTVVGGRVNSYYYGAYEQGNPWWFGYGAFRPMTGDMDASMYFDDLKDIDGTVFTCQKLEIIRAWAKVTKWDYTPDSQDTRWEIMNYEILNFLTAQDRMMGIDTPIFVQTKILEVTTQHGFIQSLYIAITNLGATIWKGALGFTKIFIGAIDSLLMFLGLPEGTFTSLTQMIMMQFSQFLTWMTYLVAQVSNMLSVFSSMISFILQIITNTVNAILWIFENAIAFPINVMKLMVAILNGETITLWGRLWDFTSAYGFIEAGKQMLPISIGIMFMFWLLYGNVQGEGGEDLHGFPRRVLDMFGWVKEIYSNVFFIFNRIRNELISMYNFIRSHIPSMGGGGGETEE